MIGTKKRLEEKIIDLEEKGKYLEEKTKQATELLESLIAEFDDLQNSILVSQSSQPRTQTPAPTPTQPAPIAPQSSYYNNYSPPDDFARSSVFQETKESTSDIFDSPQSMNRQSKSLGSSNLPQDPMIFDSPQSTNRQSKSLGSPNLPQNPMIFDITYLKPGRIDMADTQEENLALKSGWWPSDGNFRWAGKDSKDPVLYFNVFPGKEYELTAKIFVPDALAKKPITVLVNDAPVANFSIDKSMQLEKKIKISSGIVTDDRLKIVFKTDFWRPKDHDPNVKDDRTLSLAFEYIELR